MDKGDLLCMMNQSIFQIKVVEVEHQEVITDGQVVAIMAVDMALV
jgi:hypothetical protein